MMHRSLPMSLPVLEVEGLAKHFDMHHLHQRLPAFEGVSFRLYPGRFLLLRGHNGAGKSTLLRTLYRTYLPKGGHIWLNTAEGRIDLATAADVDVALLRRREIGFVTQFLIARPRVAAEEIVAEEVDTFGSEQRVREVAPAVTRLRRNAEEITGQELERLRTKLPDLSEEDFDQVGRAVRRVVDKLLHTPTVKIKELAATGGSVSVEDAVTELFGLGRPAVAVEAQRLPLPEELHGKEK